jgi:murein L,D-transpeptidase YcbB/YkuD
VDKQTPAFRSDLRYNEFSPYWNIPYGIAVREILPAVARDPGYLDSHSMEIVREFSRTAAPLPQTEENLAAVRAGTLKLRQRPGPGNSLGGAKFVFPNASNIYLHGTPARQYFARSRRDFSHGCIRLEDPEALAGWLLRDQAEWTTERIEQAMRAGTPENATLAAPVPVVLVYTTVVATEGAPRFYDDIYGHDGHLAAALSVGYPYPP